MKVARDSMLRVTWNKGWYTFRHFGAHREYVGERYNEDSQKKAGLMLFTAMLKLCDSMDGGRRERQR